jgi:exodeoxyribonuclease V alpha subunit
MLPARATELATGSMGTVMAAPAESSPGSSTAEPSREVLAGLIERVTFHSPANGFCVLRIKARGHRDLVTVVGHAAEINPGEWITVSASG